jgi:hypothetical protein
LDIIIKSFIGIFFLMLISMVSISFLGIGVTMNTAERYARDVEKRIEYSSLSSEVIEACVDEAKDRGYGLYVKVRETAGDEGETKRYGRMELTYRIRAAILSLDSVIVIKNDLSS